MKKSNLLLSAILTLTICTTHTSCKEASNATAPQKETPKVETPKVEAPKKEVSSSKILTGKWILKDVQIEYFEDSKKMEEYLDTMKQELIGKLSYEFNSDRTSVVSTPSFMGQEAKTEKGTWSLSVNKKVIRTIAESGKKQYLEIIFLDQKKLVLSITNEISDEISDLLTEHMMVFTKE